MTVTIDDVAAVVAVQLGVRAVDPEHRIVEDLGAESADVVNIAAALEDRYKVTISEEDLSTVSTVRSLCELVLRSATAPG